MMKNIKKLILQSIQMFGHGDFVIKQVENFIVEGRSDATLNPVELELVPLKYTDM